MAAVEFFHLKTVYPSYSDTLHNDSPTPMSASNRAALIGKLQTALKKKYQPLPAQPTRPLLEHVLYASLLEDAPADLADEGMAKCEQEFFDWNEVRVTTVTELAQVLSNLPESQKAARRLKSNLQAIFEEFYTFDLDHLKKENCFNQELFQSSSLPVVQGTFQRFRIDMCNPTQIHCAAAGFWATAQSSASHCP